MANHYAATVSATQVGSYFVRQYYQVFRQKRDYVYQFYTDESSTIRVDGEISHSASKMAQIHQLIISLNFTEIEIKTINSLKSLNGGVLVVVSGSVKSRDFSGWRKFVQTFFLAPQEKGYFVLNDMFHFTNEEVVHQPSAPAAQEQNVDYQPTISTHLPDPLVSGHALEEEARDYVDSVHIEGVESVEEFAFQEQHQPDLEPEKEPEPELEKELELEPEQEKELKPEPEPKLEEDPEPEPVKEPEVDRLEEKTPLEESATLLQNDLTSILQPSAEEPVGQPEKQTYASILRGKGKSLPSISSHPSYTRSIPPAANRNHVSQPLLQQSIPSLPNSGLDAVEGPLSSGEGESKSVYLRNLPSTVTILDILYEFKSLGKIKHDGVFLRNRQDTGACYAFVEFEDVQSVLNAIKASPIQLAGRRVYIEEKKTKHWCFSWWKKRQRRAWWKDFWKGT